jgi:hypothetical protein
MAANTSLIGGVEPLTLRGAMRSFLRHRDEYLEVLRGVFTHWRTKKTPESAYQCMISLFCATGGESNDLISRIFCFLHAPYRLKKTNGVLGLDTEAKKAKAIETLREKGLYIFTDRLPVSICDELTRIALSETCISYDSTGRKEETVYDRKEPSNVKYSISDTTLINHPVVQKLISDMSIVWLAQEYLESKPILDLVTMWWTTGVNKTPDTEAAQLYHFDMDKIKFLKFFIYVTDVGPDNGPHCFVQRSHKRGGIPPSLLKHGYARIGDEEVKSNYSPEEFIEITGPRGTIFAEDTRGLHKGTVCRKDDRLVFELEFSNSLFGNSRRGPAFTEIHASELKEALSSYPRVYSHFDTSGA